MRLGVASSDGRTVLASGVSWREDPLPLYVTLEGHQVLLGTVRNLDHDDHSVYADISDPVIGLGCEAGCDRMTFADEADGSMVISTLRIDYVTLGEDPAWPDLIIVEESDE